MTVVTSAPTEKVSSPVFNHIIPTDHEQVMFCYDRATGLKSIIAIHNTVLGPALGGTRFWHYTKEEDALIDALRLSRGMTYKAAISELHLGGGKAVIIGDSRRDKTEALFRRYGKFVNSLGGKYITAEDVGTSSRDMEWVGRETKYVTGLPEYLGGGGDPSPFTALGVYVAMKASAKEVYGHDALSGKKVMVQGIGHVGEYLVSHLVKEGAIVFVSDIHDDRIAHVTEKYKVTAVDTHDAYDRDVDIYAPCALGATVNDDTIDKFKCHIICGAANNQLKDEETHGQMLIDRGILYAPDYVVNAGGLINVAAEWETYNRERVHSDCERIYYRTREIFKHAKEKNIPTYKAANEIAEERLRTIAALNSRS